MTRQSSAAVGPAAGAAPPTGVRLWIHAARPHTLPAAVAGVVVGLGAGLAVGGPFRLDTAIGCLLVAILLQVVANFANDLSDFRRGADTPDRQGPLRVAAAGLVTERQLEVAIGLTILAAGLVGLYLVWVGGAVLLVLGVLAVVAALAYTGGPFPYGYRALGEVFVFVFFGLVAVAGTAYLQALRFDALFLVAAIPPGALITAILVVNNLRDIPTDTAAGKRTLAVVLGRSRTQAEYGALLGVAFVVPMLLVLAWFAGWTPGAAPAPLLPAVLLPLLTLPMASPLLARVRGVRRAARAQPRAQGHGAAVARLLAAVRAGARAGRRLDRGAGRVTATARVDRVWLPFRTPIETAAGTWTGRASWLLRLEDDDGRAGWGEALLDDPADEPVLEALLDDLVATGLPPSPALVGRAGAAGRAFRAALDGARLDLLAQGPEARAAGRPVVGVNALVGAMDTASAVEAASAAAAAGFRTIKLKAGGAEPAAALVERVAAVRAAVGDGVALRLDANGTWDADDATARLRTLAALGLQYVEQPLDPADLAGAAALRAGAGVRIAADEAVDSVAGAIAVLEAGAADVLVVKPARVGGPVAVAEIALVAGDRGVPVVISSLWESGVGLAVALACAAGLPDAPGWPASERDHGLATADLLADDLVVEALVLERGRLAAPFGRGERRAGGHARRGGDRAPRGDDAP